MALRLRTWKQIEKAIAAGLFDDEPLPSSDELFARIMRQMRECQGPNGEATPRAEGFAAGFQCGLLLASIKQMEMEAKRDAVT